MPGLKFRETYSIVQEELGPELVGTLSEVIKVIDPRAALAVNSVIGISRYDPIISSELLKSELRIENLD